MQRIHYDLLDFDFQTQQHTLNGFPFTGIAYENLNDGCMEETTIIDGKHNGIMWNWYGSGQLKSERHVLANASHGVYWEWYENGEMRLEAIYEFGIKTREVSWNEKGKIISQYVIDENNEHYNNLKIYRRNRRTNFGN